MRLSAHQARTGARRDRHPNSWDVSWRLEQFTAIGGCVLTSCRRITRRRAGVSVQAGALVDLGLDDRMRR